MLSGTWAVARRELFSLWVTPLAWLLLCSFLLMNGAAFTATLATLSNLEAPGMAVGPLQAYFGQSIFVLLGYLLTCPLLSMKALAEERRLGTAELLLSSPIGAGAIVLGKYLAMALTYVGMWLPTLLYPLILRDTGQVSGAVVATTYFGVIGLGLGLLSFGVLVSAVSRSQLVAALGTGTVVFLLMLCGIGEQWYHDGIAHELCAHLSLQALLQECSQGILSVERMVYVATLIVVPLLAAAHAVERWRDA